MSDFSEEQLGADPSDDGGNGEFGRFIGRVKTDWCDDDHRRMKLLEPFAFEDPANVRWDAPAGAVVDGASIPRVLWTFVGSPFVGEYRRASVVHDVACDVRTREWQDVHRMFYYAMRTGGVGSFRAKWMYLAVRTWGPEWELRPDGKAVNFRNRGDELTEERAANLEQKVLVAAGFNISGRAEYRELELDELDKLSDRLKEADREP